MEKRNCNEENQNTSFKQKHISIEIYSSAGDSFLFFSFSFTPFQCSPFTRSERNKKKTLTQLKESNRFCLFLLPYLFVISSSAYSLNHPKYTSSSRCFPLFFSFFSFTLNVSSRTDFLLFGYYCCNSMHYSNDSPSKLQYFGWFYVNVCEIPTILYIIPVDVSCILSFFHLLHDNNNAQK